MDATWRRASDRSFCFSMLWLLCGHSLDQVARRRSLSWLELDKVCMAALAEGDKLEYDGLGVHATLLWPSKSEVHPQRQRP